ncbi:Uncharacterized conserved protein YciI, contains a putative active-site phosphohistidine [Arthrobacter alpinus]|uniref:Uncharacterized conserved protein YciI, contains a putative active-site phosphohistidine n=1 Tax=Arthrobacter alpinus TaxID=656366 RepID=A0A1H5PGN2_9MICC|nr:antibiotic biosynthesis monooxygenase [Arthrobacter alpinus]SEF12187.1 Uncharacterized conserved protein YciI, contains a putative active-site phosphohistidine [Arthrobacter alpinus]
MLHILTLSYLQDPETMTLHKEGHVAWLHEQLNAGRVIIAGPQPSGQGGLIVTANLSEAQVCELIATDPWVGAGLVSYDRTSVDAKYLAPGLFTNPANDDSVTLINVALTKDPEASIDLLSDAVDYVAGAAEGFRGSRLLTSVQNDTVINLAHWDSEDQFNAIFNDPDFTSRYAAFAETTESSRYRLYRTKRVISPAR